MANSGEGVPYSSYPGFGTLVPPAPHDPDYWTSIQATVDPIDDLIIAFNQQVDSLG